MNRRKLLLTCLAIAAVSMVPNIQALKSVNRPVTAIARRKDNKNSKQLQPGDSYTTEEDTNIILPFNPQDGDYVRIAVTNRSTIEYFENRIVGRNEELILDTLAIIKLTYNAATNDWQLS